MLKSYVKDKITHIMKKNKVDFISAEVRGCLLVSPSGCCSCLALGSLFGATVIHSPWLSPSGLPASGMDFPSLHCLLFISTSPRGGSSHVWKHRSYYLHLHLPMVLPLVSALPLTCLFLRGLLVQLGGWDPWVSPGGRCSNLGKMLDVLPWHCATHLGLSQIISRNV